VNNAAAVELGALRWRKASKEDKAKHMKMMARARWKKARARKGKGR
jgi:hypothetical protein